MTIWTIFKRELASFINSTVAYLFIFIFLVISGVCTFLLGSFYERGQADLMSFFNFHPWLYLLLVPALSMRTWSEERNSGSIELVMTMPVTTLQVMIGKFVALWFILAICLLLTFPLVTSVNYLGEPDNGIIMAAYLGSWLMAGAFLAVGMCMSAITKSQVIAFILALVTCFVLVSMGSPLITNIFQSWVPSIVLDNIASFSFLTHYENIAKGVLSLNNILYYLASICFWLFAGYRIIEIKKAD